MKQGYKRTNILAKDGEVINGLEKDTTGLILNPVVPRYCVLKKIKLLLN